MFMEMETACLWRWTKELSPGRIMWWASEASGVCSTGLRQQIDYGAETLIRCLSLVSALRASSEGCSPAPPCIFPDLPHPCSSVLGLLPQRSHACQHLLSNLGFLTDRCETKKIVTGTRGILHDSRKYAHKGKEGWERGLLLQRL